MSTTLAAITLRAQQASDNVNSGFIDTAGTPSEWTTYITQSYAELYGLLAQVYGADYFVADPPYSFTTDGVNQKFSLPTDFFKLLGVAVQVSSPQQYIPLRPFQVADRFRASMFNTIIPAAGQTVQLEYIPTPPVFDSGNPLPAVMSNNGWDEYIVIDAAIKALAKEESDVSELKARKAEFTRRLDAEAENRDAANPTRIVDVVGRRAGAMQYRVWGSKLWLIGGVTPGWAYGMGDWNGLDDSSGDFY